MASEISGNDKAFLGTLEQENGKWTPERKHPQPNKDGTRDWGFCGLNSRYHGKFIRSAEFKDPRKQLEYCYAIFKERPTRFYGYYKRKKHYTKFNCPK